MSRDREERTQSTEPLFKKFSAHSKRGRIRGGPACRAYGNGLSPRKTCPWAVGLAAVYLFRSMLASGLRNRPSSSESPVPAAAGVWNALPVKRPNGVALSVLRRPSRSLPANAADRPAERAAAYRKAGAADAGPVTDTGPDSNRWPEGHSDGGTDGVCMVGQERQCTAVFRPARQVRCLLPALLFIPFHKRVGADGGVCAAYAELVVLHGAGRVMVYRKRRGACQLTAGRHRVGGGGRTRIDQSRLRIDPDADDVAGGKVLYLSDDKVTVFWLG